MGGTLRKWNTCQNKVIKNTNTPNVITIERQAGNTVATTAILEMQIPTGANISALITRSGRRNQQSTSIGKWVGHNVNPLADNAILLNEGGDLNDKARVLDVAAIQYKDNWQQFCDCNMNNSNPYATGERGAWRAFRSFTFLTDRVEEPLTKTPDTRNDGIFKEFANFWKNSLTGQFTPPPKYLQDNLSPQDLSVAKGWGFTAQVTQIDPQGFELENRDALGRYGSEINGYNSKLVVATAANAQHREVAAANIEDHNNATCGSLLFYKPDLNPPNKTSPKANAKTTAATTVDNRAELDQNNAHSGSTSIKVNGTGNYVQYKQTLCKDKYQKPKSVQPVPVQKASK